MNLKNVNYAMYDSSCILQNTDLKLASATFSANISIQKTTTKMQLYLLNMLLWSIRIFSILFGS